ncbi:hypothetical protein BH23CHL2_BH23CHL2_18980 [soil metagenome]
MTVHTIRPTTLQDQARMLQNELPELYAYLIERDQKIRRSLARIPSPADIELSATWNHRQFVEKAVNSIGPGLDELAG